MSQNLFVDKFIFEEDKNDRETYLKGKFFVYSTLVFSLLCFASVPFIIVFKREEIENFLDKIENHTKPKRIDIKFIDGYLVVDQLT